MTKINELSASSSQAYGRWKIANNLVEDVFSRLPTMDKLMVVASAHQTVHERIGIVETVKQSHGTACLSGPTHDSEILRDSIHSVYFDTSSQMKDKTLPKLDFRGENNETVFSVIGLQGAAPFANALSSMSMTPVEVLPKPERNQFSQEETEEADPGNDFLQKLSDNGSETLVRFETTAIRQQWQGKIQSVRASMGHINIIQPDFHLHLPFGKVSSWQLNNDVWQAMDADGKVFGLTIQVMS